MHKTYNDTLMKKCLVYKSYATCQMENVRRKKVIKMKYFMKMVYFKVRNEENFVGDQ